MAITISIMAFMFSKLSFENLVEPSETVVQVEETVVIEEP